MSEITRIQPGPRMSQAVIYNGTVHLAGQVGTEGASVTVQTQTALAAVAQDDDALLGEAGDLVYHLIVLLHARDLSLADVEQVLRDRHGR